MSSKWILALFLGLVAVGCVPAPKNPEEFKAAVAEGAAFTKVETFAVPRAFDDVVRDIKSRSDRYFNSNRRESGVRVEFRIETGPPRATTPRSFGGDRSGPITLCRTVVGDGKADMSIQRDSKATFGPSMPEGGYYVFVTEILRISSNETKVTIYGGTRWAEVFKAIRNWARGIDAPAPDLP